MWKINIFKVLNKISKVNSKTLSKNQTVMKNGIFTLSLLFFATLLFQGCSTGRKLNTSAPREVRQAAKDYEKQGYKVAVGAPTIEMQLNEAWQKRQEADESGYPKFFV